MKRAVVYQACCNPHHVNLARQSAKSVKRVMPDVDTIVLTDQKAKDGWFDTVIRYPKIPLFDAHLPPLWLFPEEYDSGLYTGTDSYFCKSMLDVFELVEGPVVDVASAHTSGKPRDRLYPSPEVPEAYPHCRSALITFQNSDRVRGFFDLWRTVFNEHKVKYRKAYRGSCFPDQGSMRIALYQSGLNVAILPPNYCTTCGDIVVRNHVRLIAVKRDWQEIAKAVNKHAPRARLLMRGKARPL